MRKNLKSDENLFEMGIIQGSKSKAFSIAKKLIELGLPIEKVSNITELSYLEIKTFLYYK